jgi:H+/Cl- antiporter ClcA
MVIHATTSNAAIVRQAHQERLRTTGIGSKSGSAFLLYDQGCPRHSFTRMPASHLPSFPDLLRYLVKWLALACMVALLAGSASALFLFALGWAARTRSAHGWLVWLLPLAGLGVGWIYRRFGQRVEGGIRLLADEATTPTKGVPLRMAPLILGATVVSHLFGASVGREGTAVQMGGALADGITKALRLTQDDRRLLILAGMSAGFASLFGTPLAGAVFAFEVLTPARLRSFAWPAAIWPCLAAAFLGDQVGLWWGVQHTHYAVGALAATTPAVLLATLAAGAIFGVAARVFTSATHQLGATMQRRVPYAPLRPFIGGCIVALAVWLTASDRYIGLGIPVILEAFAHPLSILDTLAKTAFTVVSLGTGFKGGEVTPLFYIGATLGNALAPVLPLPFPLLAALGFVGVFAGAAKTPLVCIVMAAELFGPAIAPYAVLACAASVLCSGRAGIYRARI